jgi:hypothetical protein
MIINDKIMIDIDGVIRDWTGSVYNVLKKYYPNETPVKTPIITNWNIGKLYPDIYSFYHLVFDIHAEEICSSADVLPLVHRALNMLRANKIEIILNSHQTPSMLEGTSNFLLNNNIEYDYFIISNNKSKRLDNLTLIDDKPSNCDPSYNDILINLPHNEKVIYKGERADNLYYAVKKYLELL